MRRAGLNWPALHRHSKCALTNLVNCFCHLSVVMHSTSVSSLTASVRYTLRSMGLSIGKRLYSIEVSARHGLFTWQGTRPENFSYPLPTPAAARGIVESIYWHPEVIVQVERIAILNEPSWRSQVINGVNGGYPLTREYTERLSKGLAPRPVFVGGQRDSHYAPGSELQVLLGESYGRNQVMHTILEEPRFAITFRLLGRPGSNLRAHAERLQRRLARGQPFRWACMGKKAYAADVMALASLREVTPVDYSQELPGMYYDQFDYYATHTDAACRQDAMHTPTAAYFDARIERGVMQVPYFVDAAVRRLHRT